MKKTLILRKSLLCIKDVSACIAEFVAIYSQTGWTEYRLSKEARVLSKCKLRSGSCTASFTWREPKESRGDSWGGYQQVSNTPQQKKMTSDARTNVKKETQWQKGTIQLDRNMCACKLKGDAHRQRPAGQDNTSKVKCFASNSSIFLNDWTFWSTSTDFWGGPQSFVSLNRCYLTLERWSWTVSF